MIVIPAIDIKAGKCVRLRQGDFNQMTIYSEDPVAVALDFEAQGAQLIHVVDLDAAKSGQQRNLDVVTRMLREVTTPVQFGGGLRDYAAVSKMLDLGVARVVLGSAAHSNLDLMAKLYREFGSKVIAAVDGRAGRVAVHGWSETTGTTVREAVEKLRDVGAEEIVYTDIARDGMLSGPDLEGLEDVLKLGVKAIASGGVSSLDDLCKICSLVHQGVTGAIMGKAIYGGVFTVREAIERVNRERSELHCLARE